MAWVVAFVTYAAIAVATLWLHMRCFVVVAVGFCEIKYRKLRVGKARYATMSAGSHLVLPLFQRRMKGRGGALGVVFPVTEDAAECVETGRVLKRTHGGSLNVMAEAEFEYYVEDVGEFMRSGFLPGLPPASLVRTAGEVMLEEAISKTRETRDGSIVDSLMGALDEACKQHNRDSELKMKALRVGRAWTLTELSHKS